MKEIIPYLNRRLNQVIEFTNSDNPRERLANGKIHPVRSLALKAVLATPGLPAFLYRHYGAGAFEQAGYTIAGTGNHAITLHDGNKMVRKIYPYTEHLSEEEQTRQIETWRHKQSLSLEYLEPYSIEQDFSLDAHPLRPNVSVIIAQQRYIAPALSINLSNETPISESVTNFIAASKIMHTASQPTALPDVIGRNNLVIEAETNLLCLIDPISLVRHDPSDILAYQSALSVLGIEDK